MTVLQEMETERLQKRERLRLETRRELHAALGELAAGRKVIVFGSLVRRGRFRKAILLVLYTGGLAFCFLLSAFPRLPR